MKKLNLALLCLTAVLSTNTFAETVCQSDFDVMRCRAGTVDKISYFGKVNLDGTTVLHKTGVFGDFVAQNAQLNLVSIHGDSDISSSTVNNSLYVLGGAKFNQVNVTGDVDIIGELTADKFKTNSPVKIVGDVKCTDCIFEAATNLVGDINMQNTSFNSSLELTIMKSTFSNSTLRDVLVKDHREEHRIQTIVLTNKTVAHDITFENPRGIVKLSRDSKITGKVTGGTVEEY